MDTSIGQGIGIFLLAAFLIFAVPVATLLGWAIIRGLRRGHQLWRTLLVALLVTAGTSGATYAWWNWAGWIVFDNFRNVATETIFWLGLLSIPVGGIALGIWAVSRAGRPQRPSIEEERV